MKKTWIRDICFPFFLTVVICFILELLVTQIPRSAIVENSRESALFYQMSGLHPQKFGERIYTRKDYYADTVLLNLIYMQDKKHPLESVILVPYYEGQAMDADENYMSVVFSEPKANVCYFRYWHGSMVWIKPLLCIMDITEIFMLYTILTIGCLLFIAFLCMRKKAWKAGVGILFAFFLSGGFETVSCLEYGNTMLFILVMTILYLMVGNKSRQHLLRLCVINGAVTCFVDFLTIETLAFTLPMGMLFLTKSQPALAQKRKEHLIEIMQTMLCWGVSYAAMFFCKWIAVVEVIGMQGVFDSLLRMGEHISSHRAKALFYNTQTLLQISGKSELVQGIVMAGFCALLIYILYQLWKEGKTHWMVLMMIPYIRYVIVSSHSYLHCYFTYRAQMITLLFMICVGIEKIIKKKIRGAKNVS